MNAIFADADPSLTSSWSASVVREAAWRAPVEALAPFAEEPYALALLSGGSEAAWSYLLRSPVEVMEVPSGSGPDPFAAAAALIGPPTRRHADAPPFQGGLAGLASYELGLRREPSLEPAPRTDWPDLAAGLYPALLAFDHRRRRILAVGRGRDQAEAAERAQAALAWLDHRSPPPSPPARLAQSFAPVGTADAYRAAVADVVARIVRGEIFQANVARAWAGRLAPEARPLDLFRALAAASPAPFAAYLRLRDRALVSNSPERFLRVDSEGRAETRPIKGTRPRGRDPQEDQALARELADSAKDRAENLMIVDLMRNDLARACEPGSVEAPELFKLESFVNVHHLVSTVTGRLAAGAGAFELMAGAFPPGSITGAPKVQAMRVIAGHEPPRGPYCGSIFWAGFDGAFDSSVLIRTAALVAEPEGWRYEVRAGAGIVADSDPEMESAETEAKIAALAAAFGAQP